MVFKDGFLGIVTFPFVLMAMVLLICTALSVQWAIAYLVATLYTMAILVKGYYECRLEPEALTRAGLVMLFFVLCYFPCFGNNDVMVMTLPAFLLFIATAVGIVIESHIRSRK